MPCLRLGISKGLGLGIVTFGSIMKVPQMLNITRAHSAQGISLGAYALEVLAYSISLAYAVRKQLPFSTYGENASLTVQSTYAFFYRAHLLCAPAPNSSSSSSRLTLGLQTRLS